MKAWMLDRLSYANVMATVAAFLALGGVGYAAATVNSGDIVNNSVRSKDVRNNNIRSKDIRQRTIRGGDVGANKLTGTQINESTLGQVPDANTLRGAGPDAFVAAGTVVRYSFTLAAGETREIASQGSVKLTARCIDNGTDQAGMANRDVARIFASSTQNGAVLSAADSLTGGPAATDFLNADTLETDAIWDENSVADGTTDATAGDDDDLGMVAAPDGSTMIGTKGEAALLGVNLFGAACAYRGWVIKQ